MNHLFYKLFALTTAASLYYSNGQGWSYYHLLWPKTSDRGGPGSSSLHHK